MFNPKKDHYIAVNYHYVENPSPKFSGIVPCSVSEFERQVKFLSENFKITSIEEVYRAAKEKRPGKFCVITFDDGLKDNYENALPILKKYGVPAIFFIITSVFDRRLPSAHKIHILLSRFSAEQMIDLFHGFIGEFYPDLKEQYFIPKDRRITDKRMHEGISAANFKETLIALPEDIRGQFLRYAFKANKLNEERICGNLFMNKSEIKELISSGMAIGSHSHGHYPMAGDDEDFLRKDIRLSQEILNGLIGESPKVFSYPHGRSSPTVKKILTEEGFDLSVSIERRSIEGTDDKLALPRYDTMDIKEYLDGKKI